jgi:hypothetical protein
MAGDRRALPPLSVPLIVVVSGSRGGKPSVGGILGLTLLLLLPAAAAASTGSTAPPSPASGVAPAHFEPAPSVATVPRNSGGVGPTPTNSPTALTEGPHASDALAELSHPSLVNPRQYYTKEPAPMGIADFGVTGPSPGATGYEYSASSFEGQAVVRSLSVSITGSSSKVTAFELNAVVVLERGGTTYSYWIQNGLHLDAGSDEFTIGGAYVWNFSSAGATLSPGELNGSVGSTLSGDTYYFIPGCVTTFPGQCTTLTLPSTLTGRIVSSTSAGTPYVAYEYDLGSGWVTYDNVSFPHMVGASVSGFRVDGFAPTPYSASLYYDAEWVWVGAGGGSASTDQGSDINMTLSWWNGHNYQLVPTAWNFGSNTGETSANVTDVATSALAGHLTSGPGTLGVLYNLSGVGFLNLSVPTRDPATVLIDGRAFPVQGGWANLTLPVGTDTLDLQNFTNATAEFAIHPGATTLVNLSAAGEVMFNESGLPMGTSWGVTVDGTAFSTSGSVLILNFANGTYPLTYPLVPGYSVVGSSPGTLSLPGPARISLTFAQFNYTVTFSESGLPASTPWWVNLNGSLLRSTGVSLELMAPNGSTPYTVGSLYEFLPSPGAGAIVVTAGAATPGEVAFSDRPTFVAGSVAPADAQFSIGGVAQTLAGGMFNISVTPGSYVLVASASGYQTAQATVTATPGNVTWENFTLVANQTSPNGNMSPSTSAGGLPVSTVLLVVAAVGVIAVAAGIVLLRRRR